MICTHVAHKRHIIQKMHFWCLLCAHHNVPDVRTYLEVRAILKFGVRAFQNPTKTRPCSSLQVLLAKVVVLMSDAVVKS